MGAMLDYGPRMRSLFARAGAVLALTLLVSGTTLAGGADTKPMSEKEKIDALIHAVETHDDLQFIRLGEATREPKPPACCGRSFSTRGRA